MLIAIVLVVTAVILYFSASLWLKNIKEKRLIELNICLDRLCDIAPNAARMFRDCVKGEYEIPDSVIVARNRCATASTVDEKLNAENQLENAVEKLFVFAQECDEIASDSGFLELQKQFYSTKTEIDKITKILNTKLLNGEKHDPD